MVKDDMHPSLHLYPIGISRMMSSIRVHPPQLQHRLNIITIIVISLCSCQFLSVDTNIGTDRVNLVCLAKDTFLVRIVVASYRIATSKCQTSSIIKIV
jgi:hypothetical protein